jgi:general secretion pathway protein L
MLPARSRAWLLRGPDVLLLAARDDAVRVWRANGRIPLCDIPVGMPADAQRAAVARACAGIDPNDRRLVLVVPASQVLHRRLVLPVAAAADPRKVAGYEIDRQTPFKPEQVHYAVRISNAPVAPGHVSMDLYVVPQGVLDPILARLAGLGLAPDAVDVETADGERAGVDLSAGSPRPRRLDRRRRLNRMLAAACLVLAAVVLATWLDNRRAALASMQDEVDAMRPQAIQSAQLRAELVAASGASGFLVKRKLESPSLLALLDDLTRRMPGDAWIDMLTLDSSGGVDLKGEAPKAAALVDRLRASPLLQEPKLQGVIQPDPATGKERFELVARVRAGNASDAH